MGGKQETESQSVIVRTLGKKGRQKEFREKLLL